MVSEKFSRRDIAEYLDAPGEMAAYLGCDGGCEGRCGFYREGVWRYRTCEGNDTDRA